LVALSLIPAVAGTGQALRRVDDRFLGGQSESLRLPAFPERSTIYASNGTVLARLFEDENRVYVPLQDINKVTRQAVLAIEDHDFYKHGPLDVTSILRAAVANLRAGRVVQGGSTISQQLIKNTETGAAQTFSRKFQEAQDAIRLEKTYSKDKILELYLNDIYLGNRVYGIGTAAEYYFGVTAAKLSLSQAATLAGMISAPNDTDPIKHRPASIDRRGVVLRDMLKYRLITQEEYDSAIGSKIRLSAKKRTANTAGPEPYWVRYVVNQFLSNPRFGRTVQNRRDLLFKGGLRIYTTLSPKLQAAARQAIKNHFPHPGVLPPADPEAALASIVPQTGAIRAMTAGTNYSNTQVDLASQGDRSTGSAFKAFTLAAAFEQGVPVGRVYSSSSPVTIPQDKCPDPSGAWTPGNAEPGGGGPVDLRAATAHSINVVFAQLIADIGPESVAETAKKMGLTGDILPVCAITLGAVGVSPLSMTTAYSTLANGGVHCTPYAISRVVSRTGKPIYRARPRCARAIPASVAAQVTDLLRDVIAYGTGTHAQLPDFGTRPEAGKTGTGQDHVDAWFMGYIAQLCTGVWVGYSKGEEPKYDLALSPKAGGGFGGTAAAPIWHDFMAVAEEGLPILQFPKPPPPKFGTVPDVVGKKQAEAEKILVEANFVPVVKEVDSNKPKGVVDSQSPEGGATVELGTAVTINVSNGVPPKPKGTPVPNVVGDTQTAATNALKAKGFKVRVVFQPVHGRKKIGIVLSQSPGPGAKAPPRSTVTIVVGRKGGGPEPSPSPSK
jgi:penicillin-binding protein 1A